MSIFSQPKENAELILVLDIGSSSVGGALFNITPGRAPYIIYTTREDMSVEADLDFTHFQNLTIIALDRVLSGIFKKGLGAPSRIFCTLSSSWCVSQTRTIHLTKNVPFEFTSKLADGLIEREVGLFKEEYMQADQGRSVWRPIEMKNIKTSLNGYEVDAPIGQKAKDLEMTIYLSLGGEEVLSEIERVVNKYFHHTSIKYSSFGMAAFATVRDMHANQNDFLLVDIGGEVTDITMVKKNILNASVSYPMGRNYFLRRLAVLMNTSIDSTRATFSLYKDGHASKDLVAKLEPMLEKVGNEWLEKFQTSLSNLSTDMSIPSLIFLTADKDYADFFRGVIKSEQFNQYSLTDAKFDIKILSTELLHGGAHFRDTVARDPFLTIESIYINRFLVKI